MASYPISKPLTNAIQHHRSNQYNRIQHTKRTIPQSLLPFIHIMETNRQMLITVKETILATSELLENMIQHQDIYSALSDESHPFWGDTFPVEIEHPITNIIMIVYLKATYIDILTTYKHIHQHINTLVSNNNPINAYTIVQLSSQINGLMREVETLASVSQFYTDQQQRRVLFQLIKRHWHIPFFRDKIRELFQIVATQ